MNFDLGIIMRTGIFGVLSLAMILAAAVAGGVLLRKGKHIELFIQMFVMNFVFINIMAAMSVYNEFTYWGVLIAFVATLSTIILLFLAEMVANENSEITKKKVR